MAKKRVDIVELWQRTDQSLTITKNNEYTQASTDGLALTAYFYEEDDWDSLTNGIDVTSGSPTGAASDTDITLTLDTSTGITLTGAKKYAVVVKASDGTILLPNKATADIVVAILRPQPA